MPKFAQDSTFSEAIHMSRNCQANVQRGFILALSLWGISVLTLGYFGFFTQIGLLWIAPMVVISMTIPILTYCLNPDFRAYIWSINLKYLTVFHLWRIPAGFWFLYMGSQHLLPERFVLNAGYGDLAVGLLVPVILLLKGGPGKYLFFHVSGMLDFIIAVGTGLTFTLLQVPLMENIRTFPTVLIPLYGVCVTGALSVMTLDRLLNRKQSLQSHTIR